MVTSVITYPRFVPQNEDPPRGLPLPYVGQNVEGTVPFLDRLTRKQWNIYRDWMGGQEQTAKTKTDEILGMVEGEILKESSMFCLERTQWLLDNVISAIIKSIVKENWLESSVGFQPHFFYSKLMQDGHRNPKMDGKYNYQGVATWQNTQGRKVSDMRTLVIFKNEGRMHWICFGIFLDKKYIQAFDSMGGACKDDLKNLYHWLHDEMASEDLELTSTDWCLYGTRDPDCPRQKNGFDCGVFAVMISLCIANDVPLNLVGQPVMYRVRCNFWHYLMNLMEKPPEVPQQSLVDLNTPPPRTTTDSVVDLRSPTVAPEVPQQSLVDLITPPPRTTTDSVVDLRSPTVAPVVPRTLTYPEVDAGGDGGSGKKGESKSGAASNVKTRTETSHAGNSAAGEGGESQIMTSGNQGDDPDDKEDPKDDPDDKDDPKDDPKPSPSKRLRKKRKRLKKSKGKQEPQEEETEEEDEAEPEDSPRRSPRGKKQQPAAAPPSPHSPQRSKASKKEPLPATAPTKKPKLAEREHMKDDESPPPRKDDESLPEAQPPSPQRRKSTNKLLQKENPSRSSPRLKKTTASLPPTKDPAQSRTVEPPEFPSIKKPTLAELLELKETPSTSSPRLKNAPASLPPTKDEVTKKASESTPPREEDEALAEATPSSPQRSKSVKKYGLKDTPSRSSPRLKKAPASLAPTKDPVQSPTVEPPKFPSIKEPTLAELLETESLSESNNPMSRIVDLPPKVPFAKASGTEGDGGGDDSSDDEGDDSSDSTVVESSEDNKKKAKQIQMEKLNELAKSHQHSPTTGSRKRAHHTLPTHNDSPGKKRPIKKRSLSVDFRVSDDDDDSILNIPLSQGGFKSQKDVDIFFQRQAAELRQKQKASAERRRNKDPRDLNKTPEEIKELALEAKEMAQEAKASRKAMRENKRQAELAAEAKEVKLQKWNKAQAVKLMNRQYKTLLGPNRKKGKTADRQHEQKMKDLNNKNWPPKKVKEDATRNEGDSVFFSSRS